ncbi:hypothetical protein ACS0TY_003803 [Phlomoides rotata]
MKKQSACIMQIAGWLYHLLYILSSSLIIYMIDIFNEIYFGSFNTDFDGDEMNMHFPQDEVSRAEAYNIVNANEKYIVPTRGDTMRDLIQVSISVPDNNNNCYFHSQKSVIIS